MKKEWYIIDNIEEIDTPALVVYPSRVKQNIEVLKAMVNNEVSRLRPHVKTHKSKEASIMLLEAGITKFKCATIAEAEMLGMCNAPDVLLAYQPSGPKLNRFISLIKKYPSTTFSCLVDNVSTAKIISSVAEQHAIEIDVYLDINAGMNRTGISPGDVAIQLYVECANLKGVRPLGLQVYDGHFRSIDLNERIKESGKAFEPVYAMKDELKALGFRDVIIIAGGSPTFSVHALQKDEECSPGTFIYWDRGYQSYTEQKFITAALVVSRIISMPSANTICIDLGHKSIASENPIANRVHFLNAPDLQFIGHSEEHLVAEVAVGHSFKVGDVLYGLPYHICPTVALYERALLIKDHVASGEWKVIARDRKITV